eukprot:354568-Chlamydomonas_euryale.AAC.1
MGPPHSSLARAQGALAERVEPCWMHGASASGPCVVCRRGAQLPALRALGKQHRVAGRVPQGSASGDGGRGVQGRPLARLQPGLPGKMQGRGEGFRGARGACC